MKNKKGMKGTNFWLTEDPTSENAEKMKLFNNMRISFRFIVLELSEKHNSGERERETVSC